MTLVAQSFPWPNEAFPSLTNSYDPTFENIGGKLRLRGPIPPDPGYGGAIRPSSAPCGVGRVVRLQGSEAKAIYKRATANDGAPFHVYLPYSTTLHTKGKPPKNFMNENVKQIHRVMRENRKRQTIKSQAQPQPTPVKALSQSKQYDHVQSKVKQRLDENKQHSSSRPQSVQANYLRAHANTGPAIHRSQSVNDLRRDSTKTDFVKMNSQYVKQIPQVPKSFSAEAEKQTLEKQRKDLKKYQAKQKGRVPNYIEKIKEKRDEEIYGALSNAPDPECPPGHTKVDNRQRVATLEQLTINRAELQKKLAHLPIRNDSFGLRRTKEEIEKKIVELDEAIDIFSKPKVFIQIDE